MPIDWIVDASQVQLISGSPLPGEERARLVRATEAYIAAAGALDAAGIVAMLAEDVIYESQWTLEPIKGRQAVGDYITAKYETMRRSEAAH
jgi:ketosteroid isomerase-like protein